MITRKIPCYRLKNLKFYPINSTEFLKNNFYISLPEIPATFDEEKVLMSLSDALILRVIKRSYTDETDDIISLKRELYVVSSEE